MAGFGTSRGVGAWRIATRGIVTGCWPCAVGRWCGAALLIARAIAVRAPVVTAARGAILPRTRWATRAVAWPLGTVGTS